jgi:uncharacterized protein (DUF885 family)
VVHSLQLTRNAFLVLLLCVGSSVFAAEDSAHEQLAKLTADYWEWSLNENPLFATYAGDHRFDNRLPKVSLADSQRRNKDEQQFLARLQAIQREGLKPADRVNCDMLGRQLREDLAEFRFQSHLTPITNREGFHTQFPELRREMPLETTKDYENYIARLRAFDDYAAGHIELMRAGIAAGRTLPAVVLQHWEPSVDAHIVDDPRQSLLYEPLKVFPSRVPEDQRERLRAEAREAIRDGVVAGYRRFRDFMRDEYVPAARTSIGASALPDGREFYRHRVRRFTTQELSPEEVHQLGLREVMRIRGEMEAIIRQLKFDGDVAAFAASLEKDDRFYAKTPEQLMKEAALILKKMDGQLPRMFGHLPRVSYGLREVPDYIAPKTSSAYYQPPPGDGSRAGFFYLNTYNLKARPLFALEALAFHEAVPGHHLQLALQQEMTDLPEFRRFSDCTAFIEGWALYAERLGLECGFYEDPYSQFGRLSMEMWRACRLVVDTGIHWMDWSRPRAVAYMQENSGQPLHNIEAEVDRYIAWPGQALAYKTGELKIRELRAHAEKELGDKFNLRAFHDVLLSGGAVPLDVLDDTVNTWVGKQRQAVKRTAP